eukprot:3044851-Pyramimonas_sp.AAC.2
MMRHLCAGEWPPAPPPRRSPHRASGYAARTSCRAREGSPRSAHRVATRVASVSQWDGLACCAPPPSTN